MSGFLPAARGHTPAVVDGERLSRVVGHLLDTPGILPGLRAAEELRWAACRSEGTRSTVRLLGELIAQPADQLAAIAGVHALSAVPGPAATAQLTDLLDDDRWFLTEHAAWGLAARSPHRPAMTRLAAMIGEAGFRGMLAQRTMAQWSRGDASSVLAALDGARHRAAGTGRAALVDTIGTVPGVDATAILEATAADDATIVRLAAIGALGWRTGDPDLLRRLAMTDDAVGAGALLALIDRTRDDGDRRGGPADRPGLRIAQVVFHADVGGESDRMGAGDNGGLATLVRQVADAFVSRDDVIQVTTITRGSTVDAISELVQPPDDPLRVGVVPVTGDVSVDRRSGWTHRLTVERGVRRVLLAGPRPDVVHLRMADVGTLAAEGVARQLDLPVVFTAAPDPHVVLEQLDHTAALTRADFGSDDELEHWWFRARMVERLTSQASRVVLLPRPDARAQIRRLLGEGATTASEDATVVPEGIDLGPTERARAAVAGVTPEALRATDLGSFVEALEALPADRRGLPLVISVGRLHPAKGMDRLARAWAGSDTLRTETNLVIVGGDLEQPSADELGVLGDLDEILGDGDQRRRTGAILLGHRPHDAVAGVLAIAVAGLRGLIAAGGVYVAASAKEEFGLAIVEALGAGLTVVAPAGGGPATYVDNGDTGVLTDTRSIGALRAAIVDARRLVDRPGRAARARTMVRDDLTIAAMAASLVDVYAGIGVGRATRTS